MPRTIIIGAGPSGLAALKELREAGDDTILYEAAAILGGAFANPKCYSDLYLTVSNWFMAFSDFPDPARLHYPSGASYLAYLSAYAQHHDLEQHIRYNCTVLSAALEDDGRWHLSILQSNGLKFKTSSDALLVATVANQLPNTDVPGLGDFSGQILHSSRYNEAFKSRVSADSLRVLVIGAGESGADISAELADLSPGNVAVYVRRAPCIGPRYLNDTMPELERVRRNEKHAHHAATGFLEASTTNRMSAGLNVYAYGLFRRLLWQLPGGDRTITRFNLASTAGAFARTEQATYVTKNSRMAEAVKGGGLEVIVSPYMSAKGATCTFDRLRKRDFDVVVLCTGYRLAFPWLQIPDAYGFEPNPRSWYLHCFPRGLGDRLFFVGYARPHQGGIPVAAEMLSRYIANLLTSDAVHLPSDYGSRALRDMEDEQRYYSISPQLNSLVDYNAYIESLARHIGCEPKLPWVCVVAFNLHMVAVYAAVLGSINRQVNWIAVAAWMSTTATFFVVEEGLLIKWWFYPQWAVWYRLSGAGARPKIVRDTLARAPLRSAIALTPYFAIFVLWSVLSFYVQRFLSVLMLMCQLIVSRTTLTSLGGWFGWLTPKLYILHDCPRSPLDYFLP
ncbi:hypothetical protein F5Y15DRAFT_409363 [Xylariaceae sp. FL0016]|nr:hypothetical protein F5Y15DRAFT_409363 [Xylariaceae sp. FL0016]